MQRITMHLFSLLRFLSLRPRWVESPSIIPAQPSGKIKVVRLDEIEIPPGAISTENLSAHVGALTSS
jgi:hypothetical protein